jgi:ssRNA-specific RNase YbeY (16S rRNA maturation enzyme)
MTLVIKNGNVPAKTSTDDKVSAEISLMPGAQAAIQKAVDDLAADPHASSVISLPVNVLVYNEYPKQVGDVVVNSAEEEKAALAAAAAKASEPAPTAAG